MNRAAGRRRRARLRGGCRRRCGGSATDRDGGTRLAAKSERGFARVGPRRRCEPVGGVDHDQFLTVRQLDAVLTDCHGHGPFPWGASRPVPSPSADINSAHDECESQGVRYGDRGPKRGRSALLRGRRDRIAARVVASARQLFEARVLTGPLRLPPGRRRIGRSRRRRRRDPGRGRRLAVIRVIRALRVVARRAGASALALSDGHGTQSRVRCY